MVGRPHKPTKFPRALRNNYIRQTVTNAMTENLQNIFHSLGLEEKTLAEIYKNIRTETFKDKDIIAPVNNRSKDACFIESGILRVFYSTTDKDVTFHFLSENEFTLSPYSIYQDTISRFGLESIGTSIVSVIDFQILNCILENNKAFGLLKEQLFAKYIVEANERLFYAKFTTPKERYEHLMKTNPKLFNRVPLGYIASYLGITQETLSRLRAKK